MNGMPWFRMYVDFLEDPKILSLDFGDQRHFIGLLALKCSGVIDQECPEAMMNKIVAQRLWIDQSAVIEVKRRLIEAGLIDKNWQPLAWERRQKRSDHDPSGAERQRRFREKKKQDRDEEKDSNALRNANSNATVTPPDKIRVDTEEEVEEEKEKKADPSQATAQPEPDPVWTDGVKWLESKGCKNIRPYLGKLCKDYGSDAVVLAIDQARTQNPVEPKSYLLEILKSPKRRRTGVDDPSLPNWLRGAI